MGDPQESAARERPVWHTSSVMHSRRSVRYVWLAVTAGLGIASFLLLSRSTKAFNQAVGYSSIFGFLIALYSTFHSNSKVDQLDQDDYDLAVETLSERVIRAEGLQRQRLLDRASEPAPMLLRAAAFLRSYRSGAQPQRADSRNVFRAFWTLDSKRMLLLGEAGAGKTLLLLELIRQAAEARRTDSAVPIFIRVNMAEWRDDHTFQEYFTGKVAAQQFMPVRLFERMFSEGRIIPLLDGLDEFDPEDSQPIRGSDAVRRLNTIAEGSYPTNAPLIVTCRRSYFEKLEVLQAQNGEMIGLAGAGCYIVEPLNADQILSYLRVNLTEEARVRWQPVLSALRSVHQSLAKASLVAALGSPWRLMLAFRAYGGRGVPSGLLYDPDVLHIETRLLPQFLAVATQWRAERGKDRGRGYGLQQTWIKPIDSDPARVALWLKQIALYLEKGREQGGGAGELVPYQIYQMVNARIFRIAFAACRLAAAAVIGALITVVAISGSHPFPRIVAICGAGIFLIGGALVAIVGSPDTPAGMSLARQVRTPKGLLDLGIALFCALAASVFSLGTSNTIVARILGGCCCGLMAGLIFGFVLARRLRASGAGMATSQTPTDPLHGGLLNSSIIGLVTAVIYGLIIFLNGYGTSNALAFSGFTVIVFAPIMGMPLVSMAWSRYRLAILILFLQRRLPWRIVTFLQWNYNAGLMRVSGLSYQFRHLRLQNWLAQTDDHDLLAGD
jgi:hypothetical protein